MLSLEPIRLEQIRMDGGTQSRAQMDWVAIDEYARAMQEGAIFPPVVVYFDGAAYWLADGFHRVRAGEQAGMTELAAEVRQGTVRDAILYSVGANADHGVRRTNRDKRKAVMMLLEDDEWVQLPDIEIARRCGVSNRFVSNLRAEFSLSLNGSKIDAPTTRKVKRKGKTYTMNTSEIGKSAEPEPSPNGGQSDLFTATPQPESDIPDLLPFDEQEVMVYNIDARFLADHTEDVHLVITSPPYNVGIDYDQHNDSSLTYLPMLTDIWRECHRVMVEGGRICVNVLFGSGRNPWVPMMPMVINTLVEAGFTIRGQIIWDKGTAGGKTSWGSFRLPTDPGLRDTTECVIIAHKNQSHLEIPATCRFKDDKGSHTAWLADSDYFMELAQDHWVISPESAQRIGHPAPFPPELVRRLIHFYGYPGCHVLDPFGGSGTVGVVAKELGCQATLFEISPDYCRLAEERIRG